MIFSAAENCILDSIERTRAISSACDPFDMLIVWQLHTGATQKEIADTVGITERSVRARVRKIRESVSKYLSG